MKVSGNRHQKAFFSLFLALTACILTSCVKVQAIVDVRADGSGKLGIAMGMTQQVEALLASQGADPAQALTRSLSQSTANTVDKNLNVTRWTDGDYEWIKAERAFTDLKELDNLTKQMPLFEHFSVTKTVGMFRDKFILDGELAQLSKLQEPTTSSGLLGDPSSFIQVEVVVGLPGKVTQTNGVIYGNDPGHMVWDIQGSQSVQMNAVSESWDWPNMVVISVLSGLVVLLLAGLGFRVLLSSKKAPRQDSRPVSPLPPDTGDS